MAVLSAGRSRNGLRALGAFAAVFGVMTIIAGGRVLLDADARQAAGTVVPFMVWFNAGAGFAYIAAGVGLWRARPWAAWLALGIAAATALIFLGFGGYVASGGAYAIRTVGALTFRTAVWVVIAVAARRLLVFREKRPWF